MSNMDVVVLVLWVHPFFFEIVDEEVHIFGHEIGLYWRQIDAGDLSFGVFVTDCKFHNKCLVSRLSHCLRNYSVA